MVMSLLARAPRLRLLPPNLPLPHPHLQLLHSVPFLPPSSSVRCSLSCRCYLHLTVARRSNISTSHDLKIPVPTRSRSRSHASPAPLLPPRLACAVPCPRPAQRSELAAQRLSHQLSSPQIPLCCLLLLHLHALALPPFSATLP